MKTLKMREEILCWVARVGALATTASLVLMPTSSFAKGGGGSLIQNGGDTILCAASADSPFEGHYTLDFLLKFKNGEPLYAQNPTLDLTVDRLRGYFAVHYPEILPLFSDFFDSVPVKASAVHRKWVPAPTTLADVKDEDIIYQIPANCLRPGENARQEPNLYQTVIRQPTSDPLQYLYSKEILDMQRLQNPLQYSFFMVHEWLWDLSQDVEVVRKLNWLFHSKNLDDYQREDLVSLFENLDVFQVKPSACARSQVIKALFPKSCEVMELADLRTFEKLEFLNLQKSFLFRIGDFYGFSKVKALKLQGPALSKALSPRLFQPLFSLEELDLSGSDIAVFSSELAKDLRSLRVLHLNDTPLVEVSPSFRLLTSLQSLSLPARDELFTHPKLKDFLPANLKMVSLSPAFANQDPAIVVRAAQRLQAARPEIEVRFIR